MFAEFQIEALASRARCGELHVLIGLHPIGIPLGLIPRKLGGVLGFHWLVDFALGHLSVTPPLSLSIGVLRPRLPV